MPIQTPQWSEYLSCTVCCKDFDGKLRKPISLACGHTMCRICLTELSCKQCPFDQNVIYNDISKLPINYAILTLVPGFNVNSSEREPIDYAALKLEPENIVIFKNSIQCIEELAPLLKPSMIENSDISTSLLSRSMQRKLVALINCQLVKEDGRCRALRAARSLGERVVTELILQHQNPQQLCTNLWAAVRSRGCQFLGPAMQEEVLKLILLALEEGCALSRKVLVMFVVQRLEPHFPQASKTSIGHVVQLLYRASCFKVFKREKDSSLMKLKDEFRSYETLRREHDAQIVQIATEAGLRIAPDQWSSLLYADTSHKSHMQSIMDKLQTPQSFGQSVQELVIALQRTGDPGNLASLQEEFELLASIDSSSENFQALWPDTEQALMAIKEVVNGMVNYVKFHGNRRLYDHSQAQFNKFKTSMCRDFKLKKHCPRGDNCNFAHSQEEMEKYRARSKKSNNFKQANSCHTSKDTLISDQSADDYDDSCVKINDFMKTDTLNERFSKVSVSSKRGTSFSYAETMNAKSSLPIIDSFSKNDSNLKNISNTTLSWTNNGQLLSSSVPSNEAHHLNQAQGGGNVLYQSFTAPTGQSQPTLIALSTPGQRAPSHMQTLSTPTVNVFPAVAHASFHPNIQPAQIVAGASGQPVALAPAPPGTPVEETISVISPTCFDPNTGYQLWQGGGYQGSVYHVMNVESIQPEIVPNAMEKLAFLEKRKMDLLSHLDADKDENMKYQSKNLQDVSEKITLKPAYSPWSSKSLMEHVSRSVCSTTPSSFASISAKQLEKRKASQNEEFRSSDDDQFIPFDPPLVSRFGPISRMSRSLIRATPPIQVNATINNGMMSLTPVVQQPVPAASSMPSWYLQSNGAHMSALPPLEHLIAVQKHKAVPVYLQESIPQISSEDKMKLELMQLDKEINDLKASKQHLDEHQSSNASVDTVLSEKAKYIIDETDAKIAETSTCNNYFLHTSVGSWNQGMLQVNKVTFKEENTNQNTDESWTSELSVDNT